MCVRSRSLRFDEAVSGAKLVLFSPLKAAHARIAVGTQTGDRRSVQRPAPQAPCAPDHLFRKSAPDRGRRSPHHRGRHRGAAREIMRRRLGRRLHKPCWNSRLSTATCRWRLREVSWSSNRPAAASGRIKDAIVDFAAFSLEIDRVRCVLVRSFLVRNWCGKLGGSEGPSSSWIS